METETFQNNMLRLANIFHPGKFDGPEGELLSKEYWESFGMKTKDEDFVNAVTYLRDNHDGFFPQPKEIRRTIDFCKHERIEREKASRLQLEEPLPDQKEHKRRLKELMDSIAVKGVDTRKEEAEGLAYHICKNCGLWEEIDQTSGYCPHAVNQGKTTGPSGGQNCSLFEDSVPF